LASLPWFLIALAGVALVVLVTGPLLTSLSRRVAASHLLWFFLAVGYTTLVVTLFATRWPVYKLSWLNSVYAALPSVRSVSWWWIQPGLHPNQTGGMMALCAAFAFAVTWSPDTPRRARIPAAALSLLGAGAVFMTDSRAALAGLALSVLVILIARTASWLWAWLPGLALAFVGLLATGMLARIVNFFVHDETLDTKLVARLDIWTSALHGIQDHFVTGIGLGVFNQVMPFRYPYQTVGLTFSVSQAHNLLLDTALAIGVPGAIGFTMLIVGLLVMAVRESRRDGLTRVVSLGVVSSLIVYLVFGTTDSIGLTIPTSFIVWLWVCSMTLLSESAARQLST
jgi:O-antigen ligase